MLSRAFTLLVGFVVATLVVLSLACNDDSERLAQGNSLQGKTPNDIAPGTTGEGGTSSSSGGADGGSACPKVEAGADCPSFATLWTKYFSVNGEWGCGKATCHNAGGNVPQPLTDQQTTYTTLAKYMNIKNLPYINPGCGDPAQSAITCNITGKPVQCSPQGVMPQSVTPSAASLTDLQKWVACGFPP